VAVREIRIWPDPALREVAKPVTEFGADVERLVRDLFDTLYTENGIGLAATQIAVPLRAIVVDLDPHGEAKDDEELRADLAATGFTQPTAFVNPRIVASDGEIVYEEGCLSLPGINEEVKRKEHVVVEAQDPQGRPLRVEARGLFAVCLQHEIDHLDGKVFVDYVSKLKRDVARRKMEALRAERAAEGNDKSASV
jgi:peptide deformylase